jgi:hypothetical protein
MHHKRVTIDGFAQAQRTGAPGSTRTRRAHNSPLDKYFKPKAAPVIYRKPLTMDGLEKAALGELEQFAIARWPRFASIPDLGARPSSQAWPRPAVKFALTNAGFDRRAFHLTDRDHLSCVRFG